MACCRICCGCQNCTEGQEGKCCCGGPSGECCQTGEYCCSGVCQPTPCGGVCCIEGMCYPLDEYFTAEMCGWYGGQVYPGTCDPNPCVECNADEDCPEGESCCGGVCEPDPCPKCVAVDVPGCSIDAIVCGSGAGNGDPCDPSLPSPPTTPPLDCLGGGPATVTVTGSGFVCDTTCSGGNSAFAAFVEGAINDAYAVDLGCTANGSANFTLTYGGFNYVVTVTVNISTQRAASIVLRGPFGNVIAALEYATTGSAAIETACGGVVYDCDGFTGTTANGDIDVA